jgi:CRISPR system Cascade subunit CasE
MTHLTRLTLNPHSSTVGFDLLDRGNLHRRVMSFLPDDVPDARVRAGLLYRLDTTDEGHTLLIQTHNELDTSPLRHGYTTRIEHRDISALLDWLEPGRTIHYRVDARASTCQPRPGERRGKRVAIFGQAAEPWWLKQAAMAGLTVHQETAGYHRQDVALHKDSTGERRLLHLRLTRCEGTAIVTDPHALRQAVINGVGRDRTWGAGLLTIAPAHGF